jgi:hypothetical protein
VQHCLVGSEMCIRDRFKTSSIKKRKRVFPVD